MKGNELKNLILEFDKNIILKKDKYESLELLRKKFVEDFSVDNLKKLGLDEYVEGKRQNGKINKNTFCNRIENETIELGNIHGIAGVRKFGVWVDVKTQKYLWQKGFKKQGINNQNGAFEFIKNQIISTINFGKEKNFEELKKIILSPMFKGKILFMYFPNDYINIFDDTWVNYYLEKLEIDYSDKDILEKRESLLNYKLKDNTLKNWSNIEFADFLYFNFGKPNQEEFEVFSELKDAKEQEEILNKTKDVPRQDMIDYLKNLSPTSNEKVVISNKSYKRTNKAIAWLKKVRGFKCQFCGHSIQKKNGEFYIEGAHIIPKHKKGSELPENILILCPNHHKELDLGNSEIITKNSEEAIIKVNNKEYRVSLKID